MNEPTMQPLQFISPSTIGVDTGEDVLETIARKASHKMASSRKGIINFLKQKQEVNIFEQGISDSFKEAGSFKGILPALVVGLSNQIIPLGILGLAGYGGYSLLKKRKERKASALSAIPKIEKQAAIIKGIVDILKEANTLDSNIQQDALAFKEEDKDKNKDKKDLSFIHKALRPGKYPAQTLAALAIPSFIATHLLKPEHKNFL